MSKEEEIALLEDKKNKIAVECGRLVVERDRMIDNYNKKISEFEGKFREINIMIFKINNPEEI